MYQKPSYLLRAQNVPRGSVRLDEIHFMSKTWHIQVYTQTFTKGIGYRLVKLCLSRQWISWSKSDLNFAAIWICQRVLLVLLRGCVTQFNWVSFGAQDLINDYNIFSTLTYISTLVYIVYHIYVLPQELMYLNSMPNSIENGR